MAALGFTNRLAVYLVLLLIFGLAGGFLLAVWSIREKYTGSLLCWTVVFTPIGTALSVVLARIVDKNRDENTGRVRGQPADLRGLYEGRSYGMPHAVWIRKSPGR